MLKKMMLGLLAIGSTLSANQPCCNTSSYPTDCCSDSQCCGNWYGVVGTGYAWSFNSGIKNPDPTFWDDANEGYNANLGNSPFFTLGFGSRFCGCFSLDLDYTYYQTFHYQKYQTSTVGQTPGFTGIARTRFFDLDHQNVMFNLSYAPCRQFSFGCSCIDFSPLLGIGIGCGVNRVSNFHTVGFSSISTIGAVGSTTSIGETVTNASFAWQGTAGFRIHPQPCSPLLIDIAYRYYDGGTFHGPRNIVLNTLSGAGAFSANGKAWKGRLKANEIMLTLNYLF
jgi:hypothetical protein